MQCQRMICGQFMHLWNDKKPGNSLVAKRITLKIKHTHVGGIKHIAQHKAQTFCATIFLQHVTQQHACHLCVFHLVVGCGDPSICFLFFPLAIIAGSHS